MEPATIQFLAVYTHNLTFQKNRQGLVPKKDFKIFSVIKILNLGLVISTSNSYG